MGEHIDIRKSGKKHKKANESVDDLARRRRVTFKNYLREQEEELLEVDDDLQEDNHAVE